MIPTMHSMLLFSSISMLLMLFPDVAFSQEKEDSTSSPPSTNIPTEPDYACNIDRNVTKGEFRCTIKVCYRLSSGIVTTHKMSCHRVINRIDQFDERARQLMHISRVPVKETKEIFKIAWKDWVGLQFINFLSEKMKFL